MGEIDKKFVRMYQTFGERVGADTLFVTIWSSLLIEPGDLSLEDLSRRTGYSLASISSKAKVLVSMGIVDKKRKPGSKKVYLHMDKNFASIFKRMLISKEERGVAFVKETIPGIIEEGKKSAKTERDKKQLKILEDYHRQILRVEKIMKKMIVELESIANESE